MKLKQLVKIFSRVVSPDAAEATIRFTLTGTTERLTVLNIMHNVETNEWTINLRKLDS